MNTNHEFLYKVSTGNVTHSHKNGDSFDRKIIVNELKIVTKLHKYRFETQNIRLV